MKVLTSRCSEGDESLTHVLAHERLTIVGTTSGEQPLFDREERVYLTVNGEIFNHQELRTELSEGTDGSEFLTQSDCEVILHGYKRHGSDFVKRLDGQFAFVLVDTQATTSAASSASSSETGPASEQPVFVAARDPIGICPLYYGRDAQGCLLFASELKALVDTVTQVLEFPPGHVMTGTAGDKITLVRYFTPVWLDESYLPPFQPVDYTRLRNTVVSAVRKRLMSDVPWGVLLSGGLDSSLVASIASRMASRRVESQDAEPSWWSPRLHTFSIGLKDSPDLAAARNVAQFLGTVHHEFVFTIDEALDALRTVIFHLETFDITTIRASTPMYLLARRIKALGVKLVLSGEGADEMFGGYSFYHYAPTPEEHQAESSRQLQRLHKYDCLRANKSTAAWGVELTVPFLDRDVIDLVMTHTDAREKMCGRASLDGKRIEKYILRKAFDVEEGEQPYLPESVLWRQKEQFSDGVGYLWIDTLRQYAGSFVTDQQLAAATHRFPHNTPTTKEGYFYRSIFHEHFGSKNPSTELLVLGGSSIACSTPKAIEWNAKWAKIADPSGRSVDIHQNAYVHPTLSQ